MRSFRVAALVLATACSRAEAQSSRVVFLPPLGPAATATGDFRFDLSPSVDITEIDTVTGRVLSVVATFRSAEMIGPPLGRSMRDAVRDASSSHYQVDWHAGRFALEPGHRYRIRVLVDGRALGSTDVLVGRGGVLRGLRGIPMGMVSHRTLPIKFRLREAPNCAGAEPPSCMRLPACNPLALDMAAPSLVPDGLSPGPVGVTCADFNGDGRADLAVTKVYGASVTVLLGLGDGTFQPPTDYTTGLGPWGVIAADMNADGRPDLLTANHQEGTVSILLGRGDGTFDPARQIAASNPGDRPIQILVADLNADGKLDVVTSNEVPHDISVMLGDGAGGVSAPAHQPVGPDGIGPHGMAVADFNCDGKLDLSVANYGVYGATSSVSVLLGRGDGGFAPAADYTAGRSPWSVAAADFDRDGDVDLAVINYGIVGSPASVSVLRGLGDGTFGPPADRAVGAQTYIGVAGDFDNDGLWDIATGSAEDATVSVLRGNGDGSFEPQRMFPAGARTVGLAAADFDGDGLLDLATADGDDDTVTVVLNRSR